MRRLLISLRSLLVKYRNRGKLEVCGKACLHPSSKFDGGNRVGNGVELYHCYLGYGSYV